MQDTVMEYIQYTQYVIIIHMLYTKIKVDVKVSNWHYLEILAKKYIEWISEVRHFKLFSLNATIIIQC